MGRALLSPFIDESIDNIRQIVFQNRYRTRMEPLDNLKSMLRLLDDYLIDDAELKQFRKGSNAKVVKGWLNGIQDVLYRLDELLLEILTTIGSSPLPRYMKIEPKPSKKFMAQILETLANLQDLMKEKDGLGLTAERVIPWKWMESSGVLNSTSGVLENYPKDDLFGRNEEVKSILDYLLSTTTESEQHIKVINIVGLAGVGKTTLADAVYSNRKVRESFKLRALITVPYKATANLLVKNILEAVSGNFYGGEDFHLLCKRLQEWCGGKKCLLLLDDIKIGDSLQNWNKLIASFESGAARGSAIILTSIPHHDPKLLMIPATHTLHLDSLSIEDCWSIFVGYASRQTDSVRKFPKELAVVGKEIVKKLGDLPLAAKMIGSLVQDKLDLNPQWDKTLSEFLDDVYHLLKLLDADDGYKSQPPIPSFLVLCYLDLPAAVKRCFAYLSIFPKSYHFSQEEVICQWMDQGFLKNSQSGKSMEDIGDEYFVHLTKRSFFQLAFGYDDRFMMHNLVHDLATYVFGESYKHHLCYNTRMEDFPAKSVRIHQRSLRTIVPVYLPFEWKSSSEFDPAPLKPMITKLSEHVFRVLSLSHYEITRLPSSIGKARHLCYLNVSYTKLKELPDSICDLHNLQTLLLRGCHLLTSMPGKLCKLVKLRHLDFQGSGLRRMPPNMHNLTSLRILTGFVVSKTEPRLGDLAGLYHLKRLSISRLEKVVHSTDASDAKLRGKKGLADLRLSWGQSVGDRNSRKGNEMEVLQNLEPHQDLKILTLEYYPGVTFPIWLGDPSHSSLQNLHLQDCENCESLPTLGSLPNLRELSIGRFKKVSSIGLEFYGQMTASQKPFQSLKVLRFSHMPQWEEWNIVEGIGFSQLVTLCIIECPKLVGDLPNELPSLNKLEIIGCTSLEPPFPSVSDTCQVILIRNSHSEPSFNVDKKDIHKKLLKSQQNPTLVFKALAL